MIDFEKEIHWMLRNNVGLCPYFQKNPYIKTVMKKG